MAEYNSHSQLLWYYKNLYTYSIKISHNLPIVLKQVLQFLIKTHFMNTLKYAEKLI